MSDVPAPGVVQFSVVPELTVRLVTLIVVPTVEAAAPENVADLAAREAVKPPGAVIVASAFVAEKALANVVFESAAVVPVTVTVPAPPKVLPVEVMFSPPNVELAGGLMAVVLAVRFSVPEMLNVVAHVMPVRLIVTLPSNFDVPVAVPRLPAAGLFIATLENTTLLANVRIVPPAAASTAALA